MDLSSWIEDKTLAYQVQSEAECRALLNILESANVHHFKLEVAFSQRYQLEEFQNQWSLQNEDDRGRDKLKNMRPKYNWLKPQDYLKEQCMDLGNEGFRGTIFTQVYKAELGRMQLQYGIKFQTFKQRLHIFMKEDDQLNVICRNRLMDMNQKLFIFIGYEQDLIVMLSSSGQLRKELSDKGVNVWFRKIKGIFRGLFFSITLDCQKIMAIIEQITQYDMAIINLNHKTLLKSQSSTLVSIVKECLGQNIRQIQYEYELKIQLDQESGYINMHYQHGIFGAEPLALFQTLLNSLIVISIKSGFVRQLDNKIKKNSKKLPFLAEKIHHGRRETFLAIDVRKFFSNPQKSKEYMQEFLKMFQGILDNNFQIKLYFNYMSSSTDYIKKIIRNAQDNNLIVSNQPGQMKIILKLKDFSELVYLKRFKEVIVFLQNIITPSDKKLEQSIAQSFVSQDKSYFSQSNTHNSSLVIDDKYTLPWLTIKYSKPVSKVFQGEDRDFIKGRRNKQMQNLFNKQGAFKFKIWNIETKEGLPLPSKFQEKPFLLKGAHKADKFRQGYTIETLNSFLLNQQGLVAFLTTQLKQEFIPLLIFERIS